MPSMQPGEEMKVRDEWIIYQKMNVTEDDQSLCVGYFWKKKCSPRKITVEISLKCCQKLFKCALALCHSNADVERSFKCHQKNAYKAECVNEE